MSEQKQGVKERLIAFLSLKRISKSEFAYAIGVSNSYVMNIRSGITAGKLAKIKEVYPELNIDWLITGDGEMLNGAITQSVESSNNTYLAGHNMNVEGAPDALAMAISEISEQRKVTQKAQEQVDRLLNIVEKMNGLQ